VLCGAGLKMDQDALGNNSAGMIGVGHVRRGQHRGIGSMLAAAERAVEQTAEERQASHRSSSTCPFAATIAPGSCSNAKYSHTPPFAFLDPVSTTDNSLQPPSKQYKAERVSTIAEVPSCYAE
jgi:hypothetical protein